MADPVKGHHKKQTDIKKSKPVWQSVLDMKPMPDIIQDIKGKTEYQQRA